MKLFVHGLSSEIFMFYGWNILVFLQSFAQEFVITPSTVILYPGDASAIFACQLSPGVLPLWQVNGTTYTLAGLSNGELSGHNASGTNITVSVPVNGTKYVCVIPAAPPNPSTSSEPGYLYIAGVPGMITNIIIDLTSVIIVDSSVNFTITWTEPFANFDPIVNYTITIHCTNTTLDLCPAVFNANNSIRSLFNISIITDLSMMNFISMTASNTIGTSHPAIRIIVAPGQVDMVAVVCVPQDVINQCNITWNAIVYGHNVIPSPLFYLVDYSGNNFVGGAIPTEDTHFTINLPPVDSVVNVFISAVNAFGTGPKSNAGRGVIKLPPVSNATVLLNTPNTLGYSITVNCTIHPNSSANQCVVMAMADGRVTITGTAPVTNGTATVIVDGLACEETYSITVAGTHNGKLVGPRILYGNINTGPCLVMTTSTTTTSFTRTTAVITTDTMSVTISTTQPIPVTTADGGSGSSSGGLIAGAAVGGIVGAILIALLLSVILYWYFRHHKKFNEQENKAGPSVTNPTYSSTGIYEEIDIKMEPNPSYTGKATPGKSKNTPRYVPSQTEEANVAPAQYEEANGANDNESHHEYDDIISDLHIKITRNPSYSVPA